MKEKVYTEQQELFMEALRNPENQGSLRACMDIAGYSKTLPTSYIVKNLNQEIIKIANELLAANTAKAVMGLVGTLDNPSLASRQVISAAKEILDRAGVHKKEGGDVKLDVGKGVVILPAKDADRG